MRKYLVLLPAVVIALFIVSCGDNSTNPPAETNGSLYIQSTPAGAEIWVDGTNSAKVTPDTITSLSEGSHDITLKMVEFRDTTVTVSISAGQTTTRAVTLTTSVVLVSFTAIIYETAGTTAAQPSGLDLSSGNAYGISSTDNDKVDIYYSTDGTGSQGYLVQSADLSPSMSRVTKFRVGTGTNLNDGVNSPLQNSGTWTNHVADRDTTNYFFLYDNDGHYSKAKVTNYGGGLFQDPAWVEITWYYNEAANNQNF